MASAVPVETNEVRESPIGFAIFVAIVVAIFAAFLLGPLNPIKVTGPSDASVLATTIAGR